jgi:cyclopropane fatty-acyl-phospholipid synthase-like methyltransferase
MSSETTLTRARAETISYHTQYYTKHKLFESGSWLESPDPKIPGFIEQFKNMDNCRILDLGAGVGRNAIPLAEALPKNARITCVELIEKAASLMSTYAQERGVGEKIIVVNDDFEKVSFPEHTFDLVLGISTLEHCSNQENLTRLIIDAQKWTKSGGLHFISFSTGRRVVDHKTGEPIETLVETRLQTEPWLSELARLYEGWQIEFLGSVAPYSEVLVYNGREVVWSSNEIEVKAYKR